MTKDMLERSLECILQMIAAHENGEERAGLFGSLDFLNSEKRKLEEQIDKLNEENADE